MRFPHCGVILPARLLGGCGFCFFNDPAATEVYALSLHAALPIWRPVRAAHAPGWLSPRAEPTARAAEGWRRLPGLSAPLRSEEHTSELQSRLHIECRLLLAKKHTSPVASGADA